MIINFVIFSGEFQPSDEEIFENMITSESDVIIKTNEINLESLAVSAGIFESKSKSRRAGFFGPIPFGISFLGTKKKRFWVWNPNNNNDLITIDSSFDYTTKWFTKRFKL